MDLTTMATIGGMVVAILTVVSAVLATGAWLRKSVLASHRELNTKLDGGLTSLTETVSALQKTMGALQETVGALQETVGALQEKVTANHEKAVEATSSVRADLTWLINDKHDKAMSAIETARKEGVAATEKARDECLTVIASHRAETHTDVSALRARLDRFLDRTAEPHTTAG